MKQVSNTNAPIVQLRPDGEGHVYRALARVLVRRELILAGIIPNPVDCERATG